MFAGSSRPLPVCEGLGELCVTPLDELVLPARAGSPLAFVPYRHRGVADGVVQPSAAPRLQAGAGEQRQVAEAVLPEVHRDDAWAKGRKAKANELTPCESPYRLGPLCTSPRWRSLQGSCILVF